MSPFDFKFKFQNPGSIWKSLYWEICRKLKIEQLLFLHIFNFYRNFESNLQILVSGILVIISKSVTNCRAPPPAVAGDLRTPSWRARGRHLMLSMGRHPLCVASPLPRLDYKARTVAVIVFFFSSSASSPSPSFSQPLTQTTATASPLGAPSRPIVGNSVARRVSPFACSLAARAERTWSSSSALFTAPPQTRHRGQLPPLLLRAYGLLSRDCGEPLMLSVLLFWPLQACLAVATGAAATVAAMAGMELPPGCLLRCRAS
jgi:hypothetical protein